LSTLSIFGTSACNFRSFSLILVLRSYHIMGHKPGDQFLNNIHKNGANARSRR
jgi:hypothetical protein